MIAFARTAAFLSVAPLVLGAIRGPAFNSNFPDPSILVVGGTRYAFATNSGGKNVPVATSSDGISWTRTTIEALPDVGAWANTGKTWAPDVRQISANSFVMYYAAASKSPATQCVGAATAKTPTGPFTPQSTPLACNAAQGGSIDPAGFQDADGSRWLVYKVDGNSLGGAVCGPNGAGPHPTPIMLQQLKADGVTLVGSPVAVLDHDSRDGPLIEAPALIKHGGTHFLFFSSNCYNTDYYDISYATASNIKGPYTKAPKPLLVTGTTEGVSLHAPGGGTPTPDGSYMVFHATTTQDPLTREMFSVDLRINGLTVTPA